MQLRLAERRVTGHNFWAMRPRRRPADDHLSSSTLKEFHSAAQASPLSARPGPAKPNPSTELMSPDGSRPSHLASSRCGNLVTAEPDDRIGDVMTREVWSS